MCQVELGGVVIGFIKEVEDGFACKGKTIDEVYPAKNLAVKALVADYRSQ